MAPGSVGEFSGAATALFVLMPLPPTLGCFPVLSKHWYAQSKAPPWISAMAGGKFVLACALAERRTTNRPSNVPGNSVVLTMPLPASPSPHMRRVAARCGESALRALDSNSASSLVSTTRFPASYSANGIVVFSATACFRLGVTKMRPDGLTPRITSHSGHAIAEVTAARISKWSAGASSDVRVNRVPTASISKSSVGYNRSFAHRLTRACSIGQHGSANVGKNTTALPSPTPGVASASPPTAPSPLPNRALTRSSKAARSPGLHPAGHRTKARSPPPGRLAASSASQARCEFSGAASRSLRATVSKSRPSSPLSNAARTTSFKSPSMMGFAARNCALGDWSASATGSSNLSLRKASCVWRRSSIISRREALQICTSKEPSWTRIAGTGPTTASPFCSR
mmetsp:Transcript_124952/g.361428  ORF Transcript_124952/g.361428 Transcript_124952/m.361428 type:complete len:399 (-) Transcript_124952:71-1267(-)